MATQNETCGRRSAYRYALADASHMATCLVGSGLLNLEEFVATAKGAAKGTNSVQRTSFTYCAAAERIARSVLSDRRSETAPVSAAGCSCRRPSGTILT
jgi:hypothetical protein